MRQSMAMALALFLLPLPALSLNHIVNSTSDGIDSDPNDGICAAASGLCTLRAAIQQSNAWPGPDTVILPAGTYSLTLAGNDDAAAVGDLDITESLRINGAGATTTTIDGNGTITGDRVFQIFTGAVVAISGVTIQNGRNGISGGGLANDGDLTLTGDVIKNNQTTSQTQGGGGIFNTGTLIIDQTTLSSNSTQGNGGAINIITGSATIRHSQLTGNSAGSSGGGIYVNGGGSQPVTVTLTDSTISGNTATGILVNGSPTGGLGGGLFNFGRLTINRSTISGNTANGGGGIYNNGAASGPLAGQLTVTDSTLSGNTATSFDGGGAFISNQASFIRSTITNNSALQPGGGLTVDTSGSNQGALNLQGTLIATQLAGGDCSGGANITSNGFNLDGDNSCSLSGNGDLPGTDPLLAAISTNGGATTTHALPAGSPAIDQITTGCSSTDQDQRGVNRVSGACDIGAYERTNQEATWVDLAIRAELTPNPVNKSGALNYHITVTNNGPNNATNVTLSDTLGTAGINGLNLGPLSVATTVTRDITATASATPGSMNDTIGVSADQTDLNTSNDSAPISTEVVTTTDLAITTTLKESNGQTVNPGDTVIAGFPLTYTLNITNSGDLARDVVLTDQLPAGAVLVAIPPPPPAPPLPSGVSCDIPAASNFVCTLGDLDSGANIAISFVLTPQVTGSAANVALINFNGSDPTPPRDTFSVNAIARADLALTLTATPNPVDAGADLAYTFKVINSGPSPANNLVLTVTLDPNTTLKSIEPQLNDPQTLPDQKQPIWACNPSNNTLNCTLTRLDVGRDNSVTIFVTTNSNIAGATLATTASVGSDAQDPDSSNNDITANTQVTANPVPITDLAISMSTSPSQGTVGDVLRYTIGVTNNGPDVASNVTLNDILPTSVTLISASVGCTASLGNNSVSCNLGAINNGTSAGVTIDVRPDTAGTISNRAVVAGGSDPDTTNNTISVDTTVQPKPVGVNSPKSGLKKGGGAAFALLVLLAAGLARRRSIIQD